MPTGWFWVWVATVWPASRTLRTPSGWPACFFSSDTGAWAILLMMARVRLSSASSCCRVSVPSFARALSIYPPILLADEPTGNLDPANSVGIMKLLDRINRTGTTVVMATHDQSIVDQMRKRVIELDDGRLIRDHSRGVYGYSR